MKKNLSIVGTLCVTMGLLMATGIEQNLWQGVCVLFLLGAGALAINRAERVGKEAKTGRTMPKVCNYERSTYEDAA